VSEDRRPIERDPFGAIGAELVKAGRRRTAARRRRQRAMTAVATGLLTLVSAAGASAVLDFSTGVPAVDRLLETRQADNGSPPMASDGTTPARPDIRPGPEPASEPVESSSGDVVSVAYVSRGGLLCFASAEPHGEGVSEARGGRGCMSPSDLTQRLAGDYAYLARVMIDKETVVVQGLVADEVDEARIVGPDGPLEVQLGRPWAPDALGGVSVRPFVADRESGALRADDVDRAVDARNYKIFAQLEDGRTVEVRP
jgi:hypothetical protein